MKHRIGLAVLLVGIFLPRLIIADDFFIQDEQPWINRAQLYTNSLFSGDFTGAVRYPLSNHPAVSLMSVVGPVMNFYGWYHNVSGTYEGWSLDHKREAAVWARYVWGIACSVVLLLLYRAISQLSLFSKKKWAAGLVVVLLGLEPWIWGSSRSVSVDVVMALGVVGMLVSAVVAFESRSLKWVAVSGAWFALSFVSKSPVFITAPIALLLASIVSRSSLRTIFGRGLVWLISAYIVTVILWPPFLLHPIDRITDVLARAELHSTVQEIYTWPGIHPPLFIFTLSAFATVGCFLYILNRFSDIRRNKWFFFPLDILLLAGFWHGLLLLYLNGDHARKNLPVLALLAIVGAIGWVWTLSRRNVSKPLIVVSLIVLQGVFVWPYFPHIITSYNTFFPSSGGKRLLVDVGNGSRLIADYINRQDPNATFSIPLDSLVMPYLDGDMRERIQALPSDGMLSSLRFDVTHMIIPLSFNARKGFDPAAAKLLDELSSRTPEGTLSVRDVPMFLVYSVHHEESGI